MHEEWENNDRVTRRRREPSLFWRVFMVVNLLAVVVFVGVLGWSFFDPHDRLPYALVAQVPPLVMMGIRRLFR